MASDLLYIGDAQDYERIQRSIKRRWPDAAACDASDYLHPYRLSVNVPGLTQDEWLLAVLVNGVFECSFNWQLTKIDNPAKAKAFIDVALAHKRAHIEAVEQQEGEQK